MTDDDYRTLYPISAMRPAVQDEVIVLVKMRETEARLDELSQVYGLMENDISLWTDASGQPLRAGERIAELERKLNGL